MQTIQPIQIENASAGTKRLLEAADAEFGATINMIRTIAQSAAALEGYLRFSSALASGKLDEKFRQQLALAVAQANGCGYSLAAHTTLAGRLGLTVDEIRASREARSADSKVDAGLKFTRDLVVRGGDCSPEDLRSLRKPATLRARSSRSSPMSGSTYMRTISTSPLTPRSTFRRSHSI
jgi:AhpD family alkylhydroperoxidase